MKVMYIMEIILIINIYKYCNLCSENCVTDVAPINHGLTYLMEGHHYIHLYFNLIKNRILLISVFQVHLFKRNHIIEKGIM